MIDVEEVWHLAAVYDLAVAPEVTRRFNIDGHRERVLFSREQPEPPAAALRQHLLRQRPVGGGLGEGELEGGADVPGPLRAEEVRRRGPRSQDDGGRAAGGGLPTRHRRR